MVDFGLYASLEQFSPDACLEQTVHAERCGFESVWVNDHFHPWFDRLGDGTPAHGADCWTWLAAAYERTDSIRIGPGVTAVLHRHHPATIAHQLGTLTDLYGDRVTFGIGTGIPLNEHVLGHPWPEFPERARRTAEAIRVIRRLFAESHVDHDGEFWTLNAANLYTKGPLPPIHVAASGPTSARMAGDLGDGLWTVPEGTAVEVRDQLFPAVEDGVEQSANNSAPDDVETTVSILCSYAEDEAAAVESVSPWRVLLLDDIADEPVSDPREIQRRTAAVDTDEVLEEFLVTDDPADLLDAAEAWVDAGFDRVVFHSASPDNLEFVETVRDEVMPSF